MTNTLDSPHSEEIEIIITISIEFLQFHIINIKIIFFIKIIMHSYLIDIFNNNIFLKSVIQTILLVINFYYVIFP